MNKELLNYIKTEGLNSTLIGAFADDPIVANSPGEAKSYFENGKAMERIFEDKITGSDKFGERFFICEDIKIPDSFIDVYKSDKPLTSHLTFTKKGEFNKKKESTHEVIFQCLTDKLYISGKKRYPIPLETYKSMELSVKRLMNMSIELFEGEEYILKDLIDENTLFQYPIFWTCGGLKKKALYDIIVFLERNGEGIIIPLDIKYMQSLSAMNMFFKNTRGKYSLQSMHYSEGLNYVEEFEEFHKYPQMPFLVAQKSDPFYVQPFMMDNQSIEYAYEDYCTIVKQCDEWIKSGRPATGIKPTKHQKIWRN